MADELLMTVHNTHQTGTVTVRSSGQGNSPPVHSLIDLSLYRLTLSVDTFKVHDFVIEKDVSVMVTAARLFQGQGVPLWEFHFNATTDQTVQVGLGDDDQDS